jgi:hypothetical protein
MIPSRKCLANLNLNHPFDARLLEPRFLSYFTDLSYIGLVAYFWASSVQTIAYAFRGQKSYPLQSWPRILQLLHVLLYSTIVVFRKFVHFYLCPGSTD